MKKQKYESTQQKDYVLEQQMGQLEGKKDGGRGGECTKMQREINVSRQEVTRSLINSASVHAPAHCVIA